MLPGTSQEFKKQTLEADVAAAGDCDGGVEGLLLLLILGLTHTGCLSPFGLWKRTQVHICQTLITLHFIFRTPLLKSLCFSI